MNNICKTVSLRTRKIKKGTWLSFYLDYYPGFRDESTMKVVRHESLGIYIYAKPKNQRERDYNERMTEKAEALRCRRYESIVNERYDFFDRDKQKGDFLKYFKEKADKKNTKWQNVYKHFEQFCCGKCTFGEISVDLCNRFKEHLFTTGQTIHTEHKLHVNSIAGYWSTFRAVLHTAYRDRKILENPNGFLDRIDTIPTKKEHLSQPELIKLAATPCSEKVLKKAFLFACLTGLRKSDIKQLAWENIQPYGEGQMSVTIRMQKTNDLITNPISDEALDLIGYDAEHPKIGLVFAGFKDKMTQTALKKWIEAAGITKHISFHCSRHTFATLLINSGVGLAAVQYLLGHKSPETTEIYAKMEDEQKRKAANCITLKPKQMLKIV